MPAVVSTYYGSDTSCVTDLSLIDVQVTDPRTLIGQRILRRWSTPRGALASINDDPDFGWDVTQYVNAKLSPGDISTAQSQLRAEALKDEQVGSCAVSMNLNNGTLSITAAFETADGPFNLTLDVRDLTIEAVFNFGAQ